LLLLLSFLLSTAITAITTTANAVEINKPVESKITEAPPKATAATTIKTTTTTIPTTKGEKMNPQVIIETSEGRIEVELFAKEAPISTENFLKYVDKGFYDGTIFHRVIPNFMIQGGGMNAEMKEKPTEKSIKNEAGNGQKNLKGTLAMARTNVVDSATAQFFINVADNSFLDHKNETDSGFGYAVFGKVVSGMEVVDKIKAVKTGNKGFHQDVPVNPIINKSAKRK
jgi:peptidyl-prolyl cis-trans isomerase B (cyclophilin B)